ncbi:MAG TPA: 5'-3' exonuclease [Micromonospora sp.]
MTQPRPLLLVDAPSLYVRAFFGVPTSVTAPDGSPVNAVRGFVDMLTTVIRARRPDRVVCAFDEDWRPRWRVELLPSYKAHRLGPNGREALPEDLTAQVPVIREVLAAVGIPAVGAADCEADDVLGSLAATQPGPIEVLSGDRDLLQLVDDATPVRLLYCGRGMAQLRVYDEAAVREQYRVPAAAYVDLAVLRGDPSDGLPGVPGVGEATAARLINQFGSLAGVLAAVDDPASGLTPRLRAALRGARDYLAVASRVARVARDVPLPVVPATLPAAPADPARLEQLAQRWNVTRVLDRLVATLRSLA